MLKRKHRGKKANQHKVFFHGTLDFYFYFVNLMVEDFLLLYLILTLYTILEKGQAGIPVYRCAERCFTYIYVCVRV